MFKPPDNWDELKTFSEIVKNLLEALAVVGGVLAFWKWLAERNDRAADILLKLEEDFCTPEIVQGKHCIEDNERYDLIKDQLRQYAAGLLPGRSELAAVSSKSKQRRQSAQEEEIPERSKCQMGHFRRASASGSVITTIRIARNSRNTSMLIFQR
jgi:hypothetical protein